MTNQAAPPSVRFVEVPSGQIAYTDTGSGPVALFVHGVLMSKHLWRKQIAALSDVRRCIAVDLLAHGETEIQPGQDVSVTANADMLKEVLEELKIDQVDLIGNDSGGGICQIFAARYPEHIRSLTLTNCDTHDNWPPKAFQPFVEATRQGLHAGLINSMIADKAVYRSPEALGPAYERPDLVADADIDTYLKPLIKDPDRTRNFQRFVVAFDNVHTVRIEPQLKTLTAPTLIVWGDDDVYFPVSWANWLADTIPGAKPPVVLKGARLFLIEERAEHFNALLRDHVLSV